MGSKMHAQSMHSWIQNTCYHMLVSTGSGLATCITKNLGYTEGSDTKRPGSIHFFEEKKMYFFLQMSVIIANMVGLSCVYHFQ